MFALHIDSFRKSNRYLLFLTFILFLFFVNRVHIDIGFRAIPIYLFLPILLALVIYLQGRRIQKLIIIEYAALLFYLFTVLSAQYSEYPASSLRFIFGLCLTSLTYFTARYFITRHVELLDQSLYRAGVLLLILSVINYLVGLYFMNLSYEHVDFFGLTIEKGIPRMIGLSNDPNVCALSFIFLFFYFLFKPGLINRFLMSICFICIIATMSRGGLFATVVGLLSIVLIKDFKSAFKYLFVILFVAFGLLLIIYLNFDLFQPFIERRISGVQTGAGRFAIWKNSLLAFEQKPLLGFGIFTFKDVMGDLYGNSRHAHNTYLEVLLETGVIGLLLYLNFIWLMLFSSWKLAKKGPMYSFLFPLNTAIFVAMLGLSLYVHILAWLLLLLNSTYYVYSINEKRTNYIDG